MPRRVERSDRRVPGGDKGELHHGTGAGLPTVPAPSAGDDLSITVSSRKPRFEWLDGARGVAAIAVVIYHFDGDLHLRPLFGASFLAVDLFFLMSGFVLSYSYGRRMVDGKMSFRGFVVARCARLYPVYLCGLLTGLVYFGVKIGLRTDDAPTAVSLLANFAANALFLPSATPDPLLPGMFPFTPSAWSLSTEFFVSLLFGLWLCRQRTPILAAFTVAALGAFLLLARDAGSFDLGSVWSSFGAGMVRNLFEFCEGMLAYRFVAGRSEFTAPRWLGLALALAVLLILVGPPPGLVASTVVTTAVFPAFIVICARQSTGPRTMRMCEALGLVSYPLYLLHGPVSMWLNASYKMALHADPARLTGRWYGLILVGASLMVSWIVGRYVDGWARRARASGRPDRQATAPEPVALSIGSR